MTPTLFSMMFSAMLMDALNRYRFDGNMFNPRLRWLQAKTIEDGVGSVGRKFFLFIYLFIYLFFLFFVENRYTRKKRAKINYNPFFYKY